jgi:hypothetical protein
MVGCTWLRFLCTPMRQTIFRRFLAVYGALFITRGATILITLLPNPYIGCESTVDERYPFSEALRIMSTDKFTCYDVLYSGHTVNLTICAMTWHTYSHVVPLVDWDLFSWGKPRRGPSGELLHLTFVKFFVWTWAGIGYLTIIATHFHYR